MSLTTNKIDVHQFISLTGQIIAPQQGKVIDDRAGVDGSEFMLIGKKGRPFQLISQVDCDDYANAHDTLNAYRQLITTGAVQIVQGGVSGDDYGYRVNVLDVVGTPQRIAGAVGYYLSSGRGGFLIAQWTLVGVPT